MYSNLDQTITCADCRTGFVFSAGDQQFFAERGFSPPKRCRACRELAKMTRAERTTGGPSAVREMHAVTCDRCGIRTEVPFRPSGGKPVYCRSCFRRA